MGGVDRRTIAGRQDVLAATPQGDGWRRESGASIECTDCPAPQPTAIAFHAGGPLIVYGDQASGTVMAARLEGSTWTCETVDTGARRPACRWPWTRAGARASYYTGDGEVDVATNDGTPGRRRGRRGGPATASGTWPDDGRRRHPDGIVSVAWYDAGADGVKLARRRRERVRSGRDGRHRRGGVPLDTVTARAASTSRGTTSTEDLLVGNLGEARRSCSRSPARPRPARQPGDPPECGEDGSSRGSLRSGRAASP